MLLRLPPGTFSGPTRNRRSVNGLSYSECFPAAVERPHVHEAAYFYLILSGVCNERISRHTWTYRPATVVFLPAGEVHYGRWHGEQCCNFNIEIEPARLEALRQVDVLPTVPAQFTHGPALELAQQVHREYCRRDASPLALEGLTLALLAEAGRRPEPAARILPRCLRQVRELLHDRFTEHLSLDELAAAAGLHPAHLARVFRQHLGCSPGEYQRRLRIDLARRQLEHTDLPLSVIALDAGFADQSHFTHAFRRATGLSPRAFRRKARGAQF
jgi:AraC family transcriptional regulator